MKKDHDISELLNKAKNSVNAARNLFEDEFYDFSSSRSYYAMFYMAEAVLLTKNLSFSKHSAIIGAFGREFVKTKIFSQKLREYLISAFDIRQLGDYGAPGSVNKEKAQTMIEHAREFIEAIEEYLRKAGYTL